MDYPVVLRVNTIKDKIALLRSAAHDQRSAQKQENNIDTSRSHFNQILIGNSDIVADVQKIRSNYKQARKGEGPFAAQIILTANMDYFDEKYVGWRDAPTLLTPWIEANKQYIIKKFGLRSIANMTLHLDEEAPHIHVTLVPIFDREFKMNRKQADGQIKQIQTIKSVISYGHFFTDTKAVIIKARSKEGSSEDTKCGRIQTDYAKHMGPLGLVRGTYKSMATNVSPKEFRATIGTALKTKSKSTIKVNPSDFIHIPINRTDVLTDEFAKKNASNESHMRKLKQRIETDEIIINSTAAITLELDLKTKENARLLKELKEMRSKENQYNLSRLRNIDLAETMQILDCIQDSADKRNYKTEVGRITLTSEKFFNHDTGKGGGGAIDLVMHVRGCDFKTAISILGGKLASEHQRVIQTATDRAIQMTIENASEALTKTISEVPKDHPENWPAVIDWMTKTRGIKATTLEKARAMGIVTVDERNNILFHNETKTGSEIRGRGKDFKGYRGKRNLFKFQTGDEKKALLVESGTDALAAYECGFKGLIVSTGGDWKQTAVDAINKLKIMGYKILIGTDNDESGDKKAEKLLGAITGSLRYVPDGRDWQAQLRLMNTPKTESLDIEIAKTTKIPS